MIQVLKSQFRRIYADDGHGDKDFSEQEERLREAHEKLLGASQLLTRVSEILRGVILDKPRTH
jgi:hypothetical protein